MDFLGGKQVEAALMQLGTAATAKNVSRRALKKAADPILKAYQAGTTVKTSALVDSEVVGTKLSKRQASMNRRLGKAEVEVHVGTADPAGIQEEFGNRRQAANPALRPAWEAHGGQVALDNIGKEHRTEIEKAAARAARKALKG
jgi:Bacteriophage HK97-gp10, putative tail-component